MLVLKANGLCLCVAFIAVSLSYFVKLGDNSLPQQCIQLQRNVHCRCFNVVVYGNWLNFGPLTKVKTCLRYILMQELHILNQFNCDKQNDIFKLAILCKLTVKMWNECFTLLSQGTCRSASLLTTHKLHPHKGSWLHTRTYLLNAHCNLEWI